MAAASKSCHAKLCRRHCRSSRQNYLQVSSVETLGLDISRSRRLPFFGGIADLSRFLPFYKEKSQKLCEPVGGPVMIVPQSLSRGSPPIAFRMSPLLYYNYNNAHHHVKPASMLLCSFSTDNLRLTDDAEKVYQIMNRSSSADDLKQCLRMGGMSLSNELMDKVLKRVRFSHGNPIKALELFRYADGKRGFYHTAFSLDTMLYILGRSRKFNLVWDLLLEMKRKDRSIITRRTVMVVLARVAKVCSVRETVESFRKFKKYVPKFDTACFNGLLRTLCHEKSMTDARNVYHGLKHDFRPDIMTFNILLSGWKSSEEAESFFNEMKEMGVKPDLVSYNCLIDVYCKGREMDKAYKVIEEMKEDDIMPDTITYTSIIGGLGLIGQPDKARDVLKEMKEYGCYPDAAAYNAVIRNYCIVKRLGDAFSLMEEMTQKGLNPNPTTYNLFFRVFFWSNDLQSAWNLYQRMMMMDDAAGCLPNTQSCMFLMRLCKRQEKMEPALRLWNDMVEKGFGSYILVSDVLFDLLCDLGKLVEAEKCFLQMVEKGYKPSNVAFRRIKVLMELANKHEALQTLSEKMLTTNLSSSDLR